jgi:N-acetylmuramoyl-L-alanine amidase-like protein
MAGGNRPSDLNGWYEIVTDYQGSPAYANEVYGVLEDGATKETLDGERISLSSHPEAETQPIFIAQASGEAPGSTWYGNNGGRNRTNASRGATQIDKIVVHVGQGDYWSIIDWFRHPDNTGSSAHYTVSKQGAVGQSVKEEDIAWHAGWWKTNKASIGIEHAGYVNNPSWFTEDMYRASARLSAYLSKRYKIPLDRKHIIGHHEVPGCPGAGGGVSCHTDPGKNWKWGKYMDLIKRYRTRM